MYRPKIMILAFTLFVLSAAGMQAQRRADWDLANDAAAVTIVLTRLEVTNRTLELSYQIRNTSEDDAWILAGEGKYEIGAAAFMDEDGRTLLIRERLDVPSSGTGGSPFFGRYLRLRPGDSQTESVSFTTPVHPQYGVGVIERKARGLEYARRLVVEIGYYAGDLPAMIRSILEEAEKPSDKRPVSYPINPSTVEDWFGGLLHFNESNERLRSRNEEVLIPYTNQALKGEQVLRLTVDNLRIPYEEKEERARLYPPDLGSCTRVEIQYRPSALEYFFPYRGQQSLMRLSERQDLRSSRTIVVDDPGRIKALAHDIRKAVPTTGIVRERTVAHVVCYDGDEHLVSFSMYNDDSIVTKRGYRFTRDKPLRSLRMLTPGIRQFELRTQCAVNMRDLWNRLRLYHRAEKQRLKDSSSKGEVVYPISTEWCDAIVPAYKSIGMVDYWIMQPHMCPSAGDGKNHYAMNPNCKPDCPPDMVLLFETKAGWNQHGGPELFTFDNHDPKGGCVLLNDGTVKFIRTKEELEQLRWK